MDPYSMGGWGKGLQGAGDALAQLASFYESRRRDKATRDEQAAAAKTAAEERARRQAEADRLYNQNLELKKFELGLEEAEPLERRLRGPGLADAANAAPMDDPAGWRGAPLTFDRAPLEAMAIDAAKRLQGGRSMTMTDASGKATRYFQPRENTAEGRAAAAREGYFKGLEGQGFTPEQVGQIRALYDAPDGLAKEILGVIKPPEPETPWSKAGFANEKDYLDHMRRVANVNRAPREPSPTPAARPPVRPTEAQEKSYLYYDTMSRAFSEMQAVEENGNVRGWNIQTALRTPMGAGNIVLNPAEQQYLRAARDFTAGILRKESGAAITGDELRDVFNRYIEAPGESQQLRESKRKAREAYMNSMKDLAAPATQYYNWSRTSGGTGGLPTSDMTMGELIEFYMSGGR